MEAMMKKEKIALKPYLEKIYRYISDLSKESLIDMILDLAEAVPAGERVAFLDTIGSLVPLPADSSQIKTGDIQELCDEIEALKESIQERIESIENGSYWDDNDHWDDDDEDVEHLTDDQCAELVEFFEEAGRFFRQSDFESAKLLYQGLVHLFDELGDDIFMDWPEKLGLREERARYCRCVYETTPPENRLTAFAESMHADAGIPQSAFICFHPNFSEETDSYFDEFPLLQDVVDSHPQEMSDLEKFLPVWREHLAQKTEQSRAALLLLEAVFLLEGLEGVSKLARKWQNRQPLGYLRLLQLLKEQNDTQTIVETSVEAMEVIENGSLRQIAAEFLVRAAEELDDAENLLFAKRARFLAKPNNPDLLALVIEAGRQNRRDEELARIIFFFESSSTYHDDFKKLYVKMLLMAGKLTDAFSIVSAEKSLGWSYARQIGLVFGAVLWVVSDFNEKAAVIKSLIAEYSDKPAFYSGGLLAEKKTVSSIQNEITKGLKPKRLSKADRDELLSWAEAIGRNRIDRIVSNQHRKAYQRAAEVLCALVEAFMSLGRKDHAAHLMQGFYADKFKRHSAFRKRVQDVYLSSGLLKKSGILS